MDSQESIQPDMLKQSVPFIILATLAVVARGFSRRYRKAAFGADDYTIVLALVSFWTLFTTEPWTVLTESRSLLGVALLSLSLVMVPRLRLIYNSKPPYQTLT